MNTLPHELIAKNAYKKYFYNRVSFEACSSKSGITLFSMILLQ